MNGEVELQRRVIVPKNVSAHQLSTLSGSQWTACATHQTRPFLSESISMLQGGYKAVLEARSRDEFSQEIGNFARSMGFERFSAMTVVDHSLGRSEFVTIDNCPPSFKEIWNHQNYQAFREALLKSRSEIEICRNCTEGTKVWA